MVDQAPGASGVTGPAEATTEGNASDQTAAATRRAARETAIQIGLRAGLMLAGLNLVNWLAGLAAGGALADTGAGGVFISPTLRELAVLATAGLFFARAVLFCLAGYRAAKRTGSAVRGALAGMLAGAVDGVGGLVAALLGAALFPMYTLTAGYTTSVQPVGNMLFIPLAELLALGAAGLLLGGIGSGMWENNDGVAAARR